ncbi:unnamed protein product [Caenorhabditis angaria]|uniref:Kinesin-like protein n=1 Tax=Caenorhabditis angaria TaxID=860376 RepID=A0A9P1II71_9PELO|nr:unnamed protein product [Caenorhabditis angaria]
MSSRVPSPAVRAASQLKRRSISKLQGAPPTKTAARATAPTTSTTRRAALTERSLNCPLPDRSNGRVTTLGGVTSSKATRTSATPILPPRSSLASTRPATGSRINSRAPTPTKEAAENERLRDQVKLMQSTQETQTVMMEMLKEKADMLQNQLTMMSSQLEMEKMKNQTMAMKLETAANEIGEKSTSLNDAREQLEEKDATLRRLHNDVVDLRGQIRVSIRVRPKLSFEDGSSTAIQYPNRNAIAFDQKQSFEFENVFTEVFSQKDVFASVKELILSCLHGYNVSLIAFGQTGSGKTYTMRGGSEDKEEHGVIPRSVSFLFEESKKLESLGWRFEFLMSFIEIYNNEPFDLLNKHQKLKIRLASNSVELDGLTEHTVVKKSDVNRLLEMADSNRKTAATKCNAHSSRSHAIFQWTVKAEQEKTGISTTSVLKLVDLAGSERAKESGVVGDRFQEMTHINQSLSCLQKCISLQRSKAAHVPYRDTKLTQCLKDCLGGGSSKTMVIVNINPCDENVNESKRSCEFAAKMRETKIGAAVQQRDLNSTKTSCK